MSYVILLATVWLQIAMGPPHGRCAPLAPGGRSSPLPADDRLGLILRLNNAEIEPAVLIKVISRETGLQILAELHFDKQLIRLRSAELTARQAMEQIATQLVGGWRRVGDIYALEPSALLCKLLPMDAPQLRLYSERALLSVLNRLTPKEKKVLRGGGRVLGEDLTEEVRSLLREGILAAAIGGLRRGERRDLDVGGSLRITYQPGGRELLVHLERDGETRGPVASYAVQHRLD